MAGTAVKRTSQIVVPQKPHWHQRAVGWIIFALIRIVSATIRYRVNDRSADLKRLSSAPAIFCTWHNRLVLSMIIYSKIRHTAPGLAVMVSASKDGGFLTGILQCFGAEPVRGSTSRRGPQALKELTTWARRGYDLALTPDGPRGPCYVVQDGAVALSQLTQLPIIPVTYNLAWKIRIRSWDRFQIPLPFSRCEIIFEKPIRVPRETAESGREQFRLELENAMKKITRD